MSVKKGQPICMQGSLEFPGNMPFYPVRCSTATGSSQPYITAEEAARVTVSCENPLGLDIITCRHPHREEFVEEVDGLDLDVTLKDSLDTIPQYIPVLDFASRNLTTVPSDLPVVGVTLHDVINGGARIIAGSYHEQPNISFKRKLLTYPAFRKKKTLLFLTGPDTLIETVWHQRDAVHLFDEIAGMNFHGVGAFNFSVIDGECSFAHALNLKRSIFSAGLIQQHDVLAIPHVYAVTPRQIERWYGWFSANPAIHYFTMNCQLQKSENDIAQVITTVKTLLLKLPYLHVILQGFDFDQLYRFGQLLERIHVADKVPAKFAHVRRKIYLDNEGRLRDNEKSKMKKPLLLKNNINKRNQYFTELLAKMTANKIIQPVYQKK